MGVTIKKDGKQVKTIGEVKVTPPTEAPETVTPPPEVPVHKPATNAPKLLKTKVGIHPAHQFTLKMPLAEKDAMKILAIKLGVTSTAMITEALLELLNAPPRDMTYPPLPAAGTSRFVFKVTPELAKRVHELAVMQGVSSQGVISIALDRLRQKHGLTI